MTYFQVFVYGVVLQWLFELSQLLKVGRTANHAMVCRGHSVMTITNYIECRRYDIMHAIPWICIYGAEDSAP